MAEAKVDEQEFIRMFSELGATEMANKLGMNVRTIHARRRAIEGRLKIQLNGPGQNWDSFYPKRLPIEMKDGIILIGSDAHYWPDVITTAHKGFCFLAKELQPKAIILNGDAFDGARAGRHPRIGWAKTPTLKAEKEAVLDRTHELIESCKSADRFWTLGNHDLRYESMLSNKVPEVEEMEGMTLQDQFPLWKFAVSLWINDNVVVKHRFKGGVHATHNNTVNAGMTIVTGHLHSLKVTPFDDYRGTRWGIDTGTLAEPSSEFVGGPQFDYNEDNPQNHRSGLVVLTFKDGKLLWPEIARTVEPGVIDFRGKLIKV